MSSNPRNHDRGPSTSSEFASPDPRSHSPSHSHISQDSPSNSDDDLQPTPPQSLTDADHRRDGPSASTPSARQKASDTAATALPFGLSLTLQNTGSVARDHLASERTFLAYVRTSLSFASAGVALVQLFRVSVSASGNGPQLAVARYARPLGATLIGFGIAVLVMGTLRYFAVQRALPQGLFPAARLSVFLQAVSLAALVGIVFGVLVTVH